MLDTLTRDLRYAFRMIGKTPAVSAIAIVSLALGITANGMIFGVVNSWLLRPLPYPDAERLTMLYEAEPAVDDDTRLVAPANFFSWRDESRSFESMLAISFRSAILTGSDRPEQIDIAEVFPEFFEVLDNTPITGRTFADGEGGPAAEPVVVMKETLWRDRYGSDPATVGSTVLLDGTPHTVVGIMPETFDFVLGTVGLWKADDFETRRDERDRRELFVTGVLREGVTLDEAQAELAVVAASLEERFPETNRGVRVDARSFRENFPGRSDTILVQLLMGVVVLVLLVACVNVANLYLAKADAQQRELSIRTALGAGRAVLFRQLITESIVLASIAGVLGLLGAYAGLQWLVHSAFPDEIPAFFTPRFDGTVILFTLGIAAMAGVTFGVSPALQGLRGDSIAALGEGGRGGSAGRARKRMRSALVSVEFAMALAVLIGAGLLFDLLHTRLGVEPGFDPQGLITAEINVPAYKHADAEARLRFYDALERELEATPGHTGWALTGVLPRANGFTTVPFSFDARPEADEDRPWALAMTTSTTYFDTMEIPLVVGRSFGADDRPERPLVVMVNESFVAEHFAGRDPLGERITVFDASREIVGVAGDIVQTRLSGLEPIPATVYFPVAQLPPTRAYLVARAAGEPHALAGPLQEAVWRVDADQPISNVRTIDEHFELVLSGPQTVTRIVFSIGLLTLALASIGVYGVMAFAVSQQAREIGIRMALGAQAGRVLRQVGGHGLKLAGIGLVLGIPLATLVVRALQAAMTSPEFSGPGRLDATPMVAVTALLLGVAMLACYLPARRATKIDPIRALQE